MRIGDQNHLGHTESKGSGEVDVDNSSERH